jgi:hypothetical protein
MFADLPRTGRKPVVEPGAVGRRGLCKTASGTGATVWMQPAMIGG